MSHCAGVLVYTSIILNLSDCSLVCVMPFPNAQFSLLQDSNWKGFQNLSASTNKKMV